MNSGGHSDFPQEFDQGVKRLLLQMAAWAAVVIAGLYLAGQGDKVLGLLVGTTISVVYFLLICYRVRRSASMTPRAAVSYMRTGWLIRLAFIVMMLIWSLKVPAVNFIFAVVGLLSLQIVLLLNGFFFVVKRLLAR